MQKSVPTTTVLSLIVAIITVALAVYVSSAKKSEQQKTKIPSPSEIAKSESQGLAAFFNLEESEQQQVYLLYKAYEEIRVPYVNDGLKTSKKEELLSREDIKKHADDMAKIHLDLTEGMKQILTEEQFQQWEKKDRRSVNIFKPRDTAARDTSHSPTITEK